MHGMKPKPLYWFGYLFRIISPTRGNSLKSGLLRWAGARVGENIEIASSEVILGIFSFTIGDNCYVGHETLIFGPTGSSVTIEDFAKVGSRVILTAGSHRSSTDGDWIEKEGVFSMCAYV
jgi:acetyltransferase-like isoleucine patch superfamily enzyme